jgi:predicted transglutaminase-like cysteine proteinase
VAGFSVDHVRLVTLHNWRHNFDHMVAAVFYNEEWLILDNLTNVIVRDSDKRDYAPMVVLDYKGVRRYPSPFWMIE